MFESVNNHQESRVYECIRSLAPRYPTVCDQDLLADVACLALNQLEPRYVRHTIDMHFFEAEDVRLQHERAVQSAVHAAFRLIEHQLRTGDRRRQATIDQLSI